MRGGIHARRPATQLVLALTVLSASALGASACGDDSSGSGASGQGGTGTGGGGTGGAGGSTSSITTTTGLPDECDPLELVGGQSVAAGCGIFVNPMAEDGGDGTQGSPFNSLAVALAEAKMQIPTRSVYVCAATEPVNEAIVLDEDEYVVGGVDCDTWQAAGTKTEWTDMTGGVPLTLMGGEPKHVQGFRIIAQNATGFDGATLQGNSSIAVIADGAVATLKAVEVIAGTGANGGDGADQVGQAPGWQSDQASFNGNPGGGCGVDTGNGPKVYMCPDGVQTVGGAGGDGNLNIGNPGSDGTPDYGMSTGKGGNGEPMAGYTCAGGLGNGTLGDDGPSGGAGAGGLANAGSVSLTGFAGDAGDAGGNGQPGEGGGGGGGRKGNGTNGCLSGVTGPAGGGGGAGGCGGLGGGGGGAGGASIALLSLGSMLTLTDVVLSSAAGGPGGAGGEAQIGGVGGNGADGGGTATQACDGGGGGAGGPGGPGGGGAGGPSLGIAWTGTEPVIDPANITVAGAAAMGGPGGTGGNAGQPGLTVKVQGY